MSTLRDATCHRRSCMNCASAKQRCNLQTPQCHRCSRKKVQCVYVNQPSTLQSETPEATPPARALWYQNPYDVLSSYPTIDFSLDPTLSPLCDISLITESNFLTTTEDFNHPVVPGGHNADSLAYLVTTVKSYTNTFASQCSTPFIHKQLYRGKLPKTLQQAFKVCLLYAAVTESNKAIVLSLLEAEVTELIRYEGNLTTSSVFDNMAAVQALILVQIIQLFDGDIRQRAMAEDHQSILARWTDVLQFRTQNFSRASAPPSSYHSWISAESLRRTILMSRLFRAIYIKIKTGEFHSGETLSPLRFTAQAALWDRPASQWAREYSTLRVISYQQFMQLWEMDRIDNLQPFDLLLLAACKGEEVSEIIASYSADSITA